MIKTCKFLLILLICLILAKPADAANPSPRAKQLRIGAMTYGGSSIWDGEGAGAGGTLAARRWFGNRYALCIGIKDITSNIDSLKLYNPQLKALRYNIFARYPSEDTAALRVWATSLGYDWRDLVLMTGPNAADSVGINFDNKGLVKTAGGRVLIETYMFNSTAKRYLFDPTDWRYGAWLYNRLKNDVTTYHVDGWMLDEEGAKGSSNLYVYDKCFVFPFRGNSAGMNAGDSNYWTYGYNDFYEPMVASPVTHKNFMDSTREWRRNWSAVLGDSAVANGYIVAPNFAGTAGHNQPSQWDYDVREATVMYGGITYGEYAYVNPTVGTEYPYTVRWLEHMQEIMDSGITIITAKLRCGGLDLNNGISIARGKHVLLGWMLEALRSGTSTLYFAPGQTLASHDWHINNSGSVLFDTVPGATSSTAYVHDSTALWSEAWGKYFGIQKSVDTATGGLDPVGQFYRLRKISLKRSNTDTVTLTYAVGRYAQFTNYDTVTTAVTTALPTSPSGYWYELVDTSGFTQKNDAAVRWRAGVASGTSVSIPNAYFRIFSSDTVLSNQGDTLGYIPPNNPVGRPPVSIKGKVHISGNTKIKGGG